ncbi:hypothetical protein SERLA73DRAFT_191727 [Serpula lacrymans var. lacrymans S7.3]|uniref:Protein kinase domain-containing protein n=2 Tax=Serpula lacrymans var. lacrymans TaxID=341189 RepID=F8QI54_SERL3|nr:uncharacterized protein SERLADRAFT_474308 [Serpula lacrymans var. lacrymans S7.9]EGN92019.1 hypothetical protein SERLA73DRAFT_191727 [Serpula lacrymans var. lacrymans S7.3]EGO21648.1 hypothetical protein SERLADRAFT_474308 [Serpula lacrymans var. lacrymans S7.9]
MFASFVSPTIGALEIAGSLCGVPYVQAAATVIQGITNACNQVVVHKKKAKQLAQDCNLLLNVISDHATGLAGTEIGHVVDEVMGVLQMVNGRTHKFASYSKFERYLKMAQIQDGLDYCSAEVHRAYKKFNFDSDLIIHKNQHHTMQMIQAHTAGIKETLLDLLTNQQEITRAVQNHQAGGSMARDLMRAGQEQMIRLESNLPQESFMVRPGARPPSPPPSPARTEQLQIQQALMNLQRLTSMAPSIKILDGQVTREGDMAVAGGPYSDVWLGSWLGVKVALKCLRMIENADSKFLKAEKRFEHEITVWSKLKHENVLTLYGVTNYYGAIHVVSPWQEHGNVLMYINNNPDVNPVRLLTQAANGIAYLHAQKVFHGNIKCSNILVSANGVVCICDFGLTQVIEEVTGGSLSATLTAAGSARWLAPELIQDENPNITAASDVYGYAMAALELLTRKRPFAHRKRDVTVVNDVVNERLTPPRPEEPEVKLWLNDELWSIMLKCWSWEPADRPAMAEVYTQVKAIADYYDEHDL